MVVFALKFIQNKPSYQVIPFQACVPVYASAGPRLVNSSQVLVNAIVCMCIPLIYYRTASKISI